MGVGGAIKTIFVREVYSVKYSLFVRLPLLYRKEDKSKSLHTFLFGAGDESYWGFAHAGCTFHLQAANDFTYTGCTLY